MIQIVITDSEGNIRNIPFLYDVLTIGRSSDNLIQFMERNISRYHAQLLKEKDEVYVVDQDSYRGVFVNGDRVVRKTLVREHDVLGIGDYEIEIRHLSEEESTLSDEETAEFDVPENTPPKLENASPGDDQTLKDSDEEVSKEEKEATVILEHQKDVERISRPVKTTKTSKKKAPENKGLKIAERLVLALILAGVVALILYFTN